MDDARAAAVARDRLRFLMEYGVLAPGGHPWMIALGAHALELRLGHRCGARRDDPAHRDVIVACGVGLAQLRLAVRQIGCVESTITFPEATQPDLLARVYIDGFEPADPASYVLYQAMSAGEAVEARPLDLHFVAELEAQAAQERTGIAFLATPPNERVEIPAPCGAPAMGPALRGVPWLETCAGGRAFDTVDAAVITTRGDAPEDWLAAGQAFARVALRARVEGLFARVDPSPCGARRADGSRAQVAIRFGLPTRPSGDVTVIRRR